MKTDHKYTPIYSTRYDKIASKLGGELNSSRVSFCEEVTKDFIQQAGETLA